MDFITREIITTQQLSAHLMKNYSVQVEQVRNLDVNVFWIDLGDAQWVARVYSQRESLEAIQSFSELLRYLEQQRFPAESIASPRPVTKLDSGEGCVLVTNFVAGQPPPRDRATFFRLGRLLGRIHVMPIPKGTLDGGSWHHLNLTGGAYEEWDAAIRMLEESVQRYRISESNPAQEDIVVLQKKLEHLKATFSDVEHLPTALVHPDLVPRNVIAHRHKLAEEKHDKWTVVDWTGAGVGIRILSLGFLLAVAGSRGPVGLVNAVMKGYSEQVQTLEPVELEKLPEAIYSRLLTILCWEVAVGRKTPAAAVGEITWMLQMSQDVSNKVYEILQS
jgi:Ser/Thr protein kinase RdoA (MazF antagonist)